MDRYKAPRDKLLCLVNVKTMVENIVQLAAKGGANIGGELGGSGWGAKLGGASVCDCSSSLLDASHLSKLVLHPAAPRPTPCRLQAPTPSSPSSCLW